MTVPTTENIVSYACNGSVVDFDIPFKFFVTGNIVAILEVDATGAQTPLVEGVDYNITTDKPDFDDGGTLTTVPTYASGNTIIIYRELDYVQLTDYREADAFPAETHEDALDYLTMLVQQLLQAVVIFDPASSLEQGDFAYYNGTDWVLLHPGTVGEFLATGGDGADPFWDVPAGGGDMLRTTYDPATVAEQLVGLTAAQILSNKTFTLPKINDTSADHQYIFAVSELTANRTITLPLLTANDTFVFANFIQTLTNKTLTSPKINVTSDATGDIYYRDASGNFVRLGIGSNGQVLTLASGLPSWADAAGGGGISAISEKTDNYTFTDSEDNTLFVLGRATAADKTFTLATLSDNLGKTFRAKNSSDYVLTVIGESRGTDAAEAGTTATVINATAHGFIAGQVLRMTSGDESGEERRISSVTTDAITLENALSGAPSATETFEVFDGIDGESRKLLGKGEQLNFYGANVTDDEWVLVNA